MGRSNRLRKTSFQACDKANAAKLGTLPLIQQSFPSCFHLTPALIPSLGPDLVSTILPQYLHKDVRFRLVFVNHSGGRAFSGGGKEDWSSGRYQARLE